MGRHKNYSLRSLDGQEWGRNRRKMKFNKICILGLGYIGLPTASMFATHGIKVVGVDINPAIIETLRAGQIHIHEPGLGEAVKTAVAGGNLSVSATPEAADAF